MSAKKYIKLYLFFITLLCFILPNNFPMFASTTNDLELYTVKPGDTLFRISQLYNTTPEEIIKLNSIKDPNLIYSKKKLYIPVDNSNYLGGGFSFSSDFIPGYTQSKEKIPGYEFINNSVVVGNWKNVGICTDIDLFQCTISQQIEYMKASSNDITFAEYGDIKNPGDFAWSANTLYDYSIGGSNLNYTIKIIDGYKYMFLEYNPLCKIFNHMKAVTPETKYIVYRKYENVHMVKPGDTLSGIAFAYQTTTEIIANMNNIQDINKIYVFQKLKIPGS